MSPNSTGGRPQPTSAPPLPPVSIPVPEVSHSISLPAAAAPPVPTHARQRSTATFEPSLSSPISAAPPTSAPPPPPPSTGHVRHYSTTSEKYMRSPPPPPPSQAPGIPAAQVEPLTDEPTGYEADEDTDMNVTVEEERITNSLLRPKPPKPIFDLSSDYSSRWWTSSKPIPPSLASRSDLYIEPIVSKRTKRGGRELTVLDLYILHKDLTQTVITLEFPTDKPSHPHHYQRSVSAPSKLPPPPNPSSPLPNFDYRISLTDAKPGDLIKFNNCVFSGHKGSLHTKYTIETGVKSVVVHEFDVVKKKIKAQGKNKLESYKFNDLKSGEYEVLRPVGRKFVGWD